MSALSCGHTEPLWYDVGLKRFSRAPTVRMPQPLKNSAPNRPCATRAARSGRTMPVNRSWPAFDARTRHGSPSPSSASA